MKKHLPETLLAVYIAGIILTWTYLIASDIESGDSNALAASVLFGWIAGLAWPFIILVVLWLKVWF
jgi:hypothetical protein